MRDFGVFRWEIVIYKGTKKFIRYIYSNRRWARRACVVSEFSKLTLSISEPRRKKFHIAVSTYFWIRNHLPRLAREFGHVLRMKILLKLNQFNIQRRILHLQTSFIKLPWLASPDCVLFALRFGNDRAKCL